VLVGRAEPVFDERRRTAIGGEVFVHNALDIGKGWIGIADENLLHLLGNSAKIDDSLHIEILFEDIPRLLLYVELFAHTPENRRTTGSR